MDTPTEVRPDGESVVSKQPMDNERLVSILNGYKQEAENDRKTGQGKRDDVWDENVNLYWGNFGKYFKGKAEWQSKEVLPEIPMFVDRWAASMREAINKPGDFFTVSMPNDKENVITPHIKKYIEYILSKSGRNQTGQPVDFSSTFEDILKIGAMMTCASSVTWKDGYTAIEALDPRNLWLDAKGRGLYRVRRMEIDRHLLKSMAKQKDKAGNSIWDVDQIEQLESHISEEILKNRETLTGAGQESSPSTRKPITLHEYYCTVIDDMGEVEHENVLIVVANDMFVIRGPEKNPFDHGWDWIACSPAISVPLSTYGKSYMENWSDIAVAFNEMTNLILDGVFTSTMKCFGMVKTALTNPDQADEGVWPNKVYDFEDGTNIDAVFKSIDLGRLPAESISVWQGLKSELREGAALNELSLGQVPPKGDITATEISASERGSASTVRSIARTIEQNLLDTILMLAFKTDLQHLTKDRTDAKAYLGEETFNMLIDRKKDFMDGDIVIEARGISSLIERGEKLRNLIRTMEIVGQNELLLKSFLQKYSIERVLDQIMKLSGVDSSDLIPSQTERSIANLERAEEANAEAVQAAGENGAAGSQQGEIFKDLLAAAQSAGGKNGG